MFKRMKKMVRDEEGAGILGCVGGTATGGALGGIVGIIIAVIGWFADTLACCMWPWDIWHIPADILLVSGTGLLGGVVGAFSGTLFGLFADWVLSCGLIASTCHQAIGRMMGGLFGVMGK